MGQVAPVHVPTQVVPSRINPLDPITLTSPSLSTIPPLQQSPTNMDTLLDSLADTPGLLIDPTTDDTDPFAPDALPSETYTSPEANLFFNPDPFAETSLQQDPGLSTDPINHPKSELVLESFDTATPLASIPNVPHHPVGPEPQQENRPGNVSPAKKPKTKRAVKTGVKKELTPEESKRIKDKMAQRKLRNKESARRYREKQMARRRQLEDYTKTLTAQNRELESLHDRLLRLTCERRMRVQERQFPMPDNFPPGVL